MFTFTLKVSNKHPVISSSFATVFALSPWIIKSLHQVAWDNLPLSSQKLVYYRELKHQWRRRLQKSEFALPQSNFIALIPSCLIHKKCFFFFAHALGINRLCSATFEQLLAFWATLCSTSNLGQLLPSLATFEQQIDIKPIQTIKGRFISKDFIKTGFIKTKDIQ